MIRILRSATDIAESRAVLRARGLDFSDPRRLRAWRLIYRMRYRTSLPAADPMKSWDVHQALSILERSHRDRRTPILDMGCFNSEILYALRALGYRRLAGCDLNPMCRWMPYWHRIRYEWCDLTHTPFPDGAFGVLTCISVVEHGVNLDALAAEASRLLRPGGLFILTTDYDASGATHENSVMARHFGQRWSIFDETTLRGLIRCFEHAGFMLLDSSQSELSHTERPVSWSGHDYTFLLAALRAPASA